MPIAATGRSLIKPSELDNCPTVSDIIQSHQWGKGWYNPRNQLIWQFEQMLNLRSPFEDDKDGAEDGGFSTAAGTIAFVTDTTPFDVTTQAIASIGAYHPYADCYPRQGQNEDRVRDFQKFLQGILDTRMRQDNIQKRQINSLMSTGWLVTYFAYSDDLKEQGELPWDIRPMHPSNVYPKFDARNKPQWVTVEEVITGATLRSDYCMYPGVAEFLSGEPVRGDIPANSTAYQQRLKPGGSLDTCEFTVVTYYDKKYTALMINAGVIGEAANYNPALKRLKDKSDKGQYESVLWDSKASGDDPYRGVLKHHLGGIPFSFNWCWPETGDRFSQGNSRRQTGRYMGLPFGFGMLENWKAISRIMAMLTTSLLTTSDPTIMTTSPNFHIDNNIAYAEDGDAKYMQPPPLPPEGLKLLEELKEAMARSSISPAAYGQAAGTSGSQQEQTATAGTIRFDTVISELELNHAAMLKGITATMLERGDEKDIEVVGSGARYGNQPYTMSYQISQLKDKCPAIMVRLQERDGLNDPNNVVKAKSLSGFLSQVTIFKDILKLPDPEAEIEKLKAEVVAKSSMQPSLDKALLQAQLDNMKETEDLKWKVQVLQDQLDLQNRKREIEAKFGNLPDEEKATLEEQGYQKIIQELQQQGQGQPGQSPSMMQPGGSSIGGPQNGGGNPLQQMPGQPPMTPPPGNGAPPMMSPPNGGGQMRPPMPMPPMGMMGGPPPGMGQRPPMMQPRPNGIMPGTANAPYQAGQPIQPMSRMQPPGGVGRPGAPSPIFGAQRSMPGQPATTPAIAAANASVAPTSLPPLALGAPPRHTGQGTKRGGRRRRAKGG